MFEIGWTEMLMIAIVLIVVVGPKDLPRMLRTFGRTTSKLRVMAGDFRKQFDEALKEAELDDVKSMVDDARKLNPAQDIRKAFNPVQKAVDEVRAGLASMNQPKPAPSPEPASTVAHPAEPAKAGPAALPGESTSPVQEVAPVSKPARAAAKPKATPATKTSRAKPAKPAAETAPSTRKTATPSKRAAAKRGAGT